MMKGVIFRDIFKHTFNRSTCLQLVLKIEYFINLVLKVLYFTIVNINNGFTFQTFLLYTANLIIHLLDISYI